MSFNTDDINMLGEWLTVGPAGRLAGTTRQQPYRTQLLGAQVALWPEADGRIAARCDGMDLPACSAYGYLWVCPNGEPARPLFAFPEHAQMGRRIVDCGGIGVATSGLRVIENFLDMGHFPFVHDSYLGEVPQTEVAPYQVSIDERAGEIWATECRFYQPRASKAASSGLEVQYRYRVMQPLSAMLYKTAFPRPGEMDAIGLFVQPLTQESVIAYCLLAYWDECSSDTELIAFQHTIFGQDKPILENQRPRLLPLKLGAEVPVRCDAMSVAYRRWLAGRDVRYGAIAG